MKHRRATSRSDRRPYAVSALLLLAGVVALVARAEVITRRWQWISYRESLAVRAHQLATHALPAGVGTQNPLRPAHLSARLVLALGMDPGLALLAVGVMALALIRLGSRYAWLPLVVGGVFAGPAVQVVDSSGAWVATVGRLSAIAVLAVASLPALRSVWSLREEVQRRPTSWQLLAAAAVVVALPDLLRVAGPNSVNAAPAPAVFAALGYGVLVSASHASARVRLGLLLLPLLAMEPTAWVISNGAYGYSPDWSQLPGAALVTLAVTGLGAGVPAYGDAVLSLWRKATHHGPRLGAHAAEATA
jgi:hypothetical protein